MRLTAITLFQFSSVVSSNDTEPKPTSGIPALQNITSSRPKVSTAVATAAIMSSSTVTSARAATASPPAPLISSATDFTWVSTTSVATTLAPSDANNRALSRPSPCPAPVITTTLSRSRIAPPARRVRTM